MYQLTTSYAVLSLKRLITLQKRKLLQSVSYTLYHLSIHIAFKIIYAFNLVESRYNQVTDSITIPSFWQKMCTTKMYSWDIHINLSIILKDRLQLQADFTQAIPTLLIYKLISHNTDQTKNLAVPQNFLVF